MVSAVQFLIVVTNVVIFGITMTSMDPFNTGVVTFGEDGIGDTVLINGIYFKKIKDVETQEEIYIKVNINQTHEFNDPTGGIKTWSYFKSFFTLFHFLFFEFKNYWGVTIFIYMLLYFIGFVFFCRLFILIFNNWNNKRLLVYLKWLLIGKGFKDTKKFKKLKKNKVTFDNAYDDGNYDNVFDANDIPVSPVKHASVFDDTYDDGLGLIPENIQPAALNQSSQNQSNRSVLFNQSFEDNNVYIAQDDLIPFAATANDIKNIDTWIEEFEGQIWHYGWTEARAKNRFYRSMKGAALTWWNAYSGEIGVDLKQKTIQQIINDFRKHFLPDNVEIIYERELNNFKQSQNENLLNYFDRLQKLLNKIERIREEKIKDREYFRVVSAGINKRYLKKWEECFGKKESIVSAQKKVIQLEFNLGFSVFGTHSYSKNADDTNAIPCKYCKKTNHVSDDCRWKKQHEDRINKSQDGTTENPKVKNCWKCGKEGHYADKCPERNQNKNEKDMNIMEINYDTSFDFENIKEESNIIAALNNIIKEPIDTESNYDYNDWKFSKFNTLVEYFGEPTIDLFATISSKQIDTYVSKNYEPQAYFKDAFKLNWNNKEDKMKFPYANGPWDEMQNILTKTKEDNVSKMLVVAPIWKQKEWFKDYLDMLIDKPLIFKPEDNLFYPASKQHSFGITKTNYDVIAGIVSYDKLESQKFKNKLKEEYEEDVNFDDNLFIERFLKDNVFKENKRNQYTPARAKTRIQKETVEVIIDSGSASSAISSDLFNGLFSKNAVVQDDTVFRGVNSTIESLGTTIISFAFDGHVFKHKVHILQNLAGKDFLLGNDWIDSNVIEDKKQEKTLICENEAKIKYEIYKKQKNSNQEIDVCMNYNVIIPARSKMILKIDVENNFKNNIKFIPKQHENLTFWSSINDCKSYIHTTVKNKTKKAIKLKRGTKIGKITPENEEYKLVLVEEKSEQSNLKFKCDDNLTNEQKQQLEKLIFEEFPDVFNDRIGEVKNYIADIELKDDMNNKFTPNFRQSPLQEEYLDNFAKDMNNKEKIRRSFSHYNFPVFAVPKRDTGDYRIVQDFRNLNIHIEPKAYAITRIDDALDNLIGAKIFTTLDLRSGFWQIPLSEETKKFTAFSTRSGHWEWNMYSRFIENYTEKIKPLLDLIPDKSIWKWNQEEEDSFNQLKELMTSTPVLAFPDFKKRFSLTTDASGYALGAVLEQNGHPISYASRKLSETERKYSTTERECLAIIWALNKFRIYLIDNTFDLYTDHIALKWLGSMKKGRKLLRWAVEISEYSFELHHRPGVDIPNADALSRIMVLLELDADDTEVTLMKKLQYEQEDIRNLKLNETEKEIYFKKINGIVCRIHNGKTQIVLPNILIPRILSQYHDNAASGHVGINNMTKTIKSKYFWNKMQKDCDEWVKSCLNCQQFKLKHGNYGDMKNIEIGDAFDLIAMDIVGPMTKTKRGNRYILVIQDYLTKFPEAYALKNTDAQTIAKVFVEEHVSRYGVPLGLLTDQGSNFVSRFFKDCCKIMKIKKIQTTAYHPQTDGMVERLNQTLVHSIRNNINEDKNNWDEQLPFALLHYRVQEHASTKYSPSELLYGFKLNLIGDTMYEDNIIDYDINDYRHFLQNNLNIIRNQAHINIEEAQHKQKMYYDKDKNMLPDWKKGDMVMMYSPAIKRGHSKKLTAKYRGPFVIKDKINDYNYKLQLPNGRMSDVININRLKLYKRSELRNLEDIPELEIEEEDIDNYSWITVDEFKLLQENENHEEEEIELINKKVEKDKNKKENKKKEEDKSKEENEDKEEQTESETFKKITKNAKEEKGSVYENVGKRKSKNPLSKELYAFVLSDSEFIGGACDSTCKL